MMQKVYQSYSYMYMVIMECWDSHAFWSSQYQALLRPCPESLSVRQFLYFHSNFLFTCIHVHRESTDQGFIRGGGDLDFWT